MVGIFSQACKTILSCLEDTFLRLFSIAELRGRLDYELHMGRGYRHRYPHPLLLLCLFYHGPHSPLWPRL